MGVPSRFRRFRAWSRRLLWLAGCAVLLQLSGCMDEREDKVDRGFSLACSRFQDIKRDPLAAAAFGEGAGVGGSYLSYLLASIENDDRLPPFCENQPSQPYCVVIRGGPGDNDVTVEGYYADTASPAKSQVIPLR